MVFGASSAGICGQLHKLAHSESDFFVTGSAAALKEALSKFFLLHCYFQDILPFVFHNMLETRRICMASVLQMSMQLHMHLVYCIYTKTDCKWGLYNRASKTGCISVVF